MSALLEHPVAVNQWQQECAARNGAILEESVRRDRTRTIEADGWEAIIAKIVSMQHLEEIGMG